MYNNDWFEKSIFFNILTSDNSISLKEKNKLITNYLRKSKKLYNKYNKYNNEYIYSIIDLELLINFVKWKELTTWHPAFVSKEKNINIFYYKVLQKEFSKHKRKYKLMENELGKFIVLLKEKYYLLHFIYMLLNLFSALERQGYYNNKIDYELETNQDNEDTGDVVYLKRYSIIKDLMERDRVRKENNENTDYESETDDDNETNENDDENNENTDYESETDDDDETNENDDDVIKAALEAYKKKYIENSEDINEAVKAAIETFIKKIKELEEYKNIDEEEEKKKLQAHYKQVKKEIEENNENNENTDYELETNQDNEDTGDVVYLKRYSIIKDLMERDRVRKENNENTDYESETDDDDETNENDDENNENTDYESETDDDDETNENDDENNENTDYESETDDDDDKIEFTFENVAIKVAVEIFIKKIKEKAYKKLESEKEILNAESKLGYVAGFIKGYLISYRSKKLSKDKDADFKPACLSKDYDKGYEKGFNEGYDDGLLNSHVNDN